VPLNEKQTQALDTRLGAGIDSDVEAEVGAALGSGVSAGGAAQSTGTGVGASSTGVVDPAAATAYAATISHALRSRLKLELGLGGFASSGSAATGGVNVGASLGVGGALNSGMGASAAVALKGQLTTSLLARIGLQVDAAVGATGLPQAERLALSARLKQALADEGQRAVGSAFGADLGYPSAAGAPILVVEVTMPSTSAWHATLDIDTEEEPSGPFVFRIGAVEFRGTVVPGRSGHFGGRTKLRVVGGAGGLSKKLKARNYSGGITTVRQVLDDILRESGEALSSQADAGILGRQIPAWHRTEQETNRALTMLCDKVGANWRVLRDGTIWVGIDTWPEVTPEGELVDEDWADGVITVSSDDATGVPGVTISGQQIEQVVHRMDRSGIRTDFYARSPKSMLSKFLRPLRTEIDYTKKYRCRVAAQNADRTLQLVPDDPKMKGQGLDRVPIRVGLPGFKILAKPGARCNLGFENGDPSQPYATDWDENSDLVSIELKDALGALARVGSTVECFLPYTPAPLPGPPGALPLKINGIVVTGNPNGRG
jgi:hypothetical protein